MPFSIDNLEENCNNPHVENIFEDMISKMALIYIDTLLIYTFSELMRRSVVSVFCHSIFNKNSY